MIKSIKTKWRNDAIAQVLSGARDDFNVVRETDGVDYIYYKQVKITTKADAAGNLLERLSELREMYIKEGMNQIEKEYGQSKD